MRPIKALKRKVRYWIATFLMKTPQAVDVAISLAKHASLHAHLKGQFVSALQNIPLRDSPLLQKYWHVVFDALVWRSLERGKGLTRLMEALESICAPHAGEAATTEKLHEETAGRPLHILFVTAVFPSAEHGGGLRVFDMIDELHRRGHEVSLFASEIYSGSASASLLARRLKKCRIVKHGQFAASSYAQWLADESLRYDVIHYVWPGSARLLAAGKLWTAKSVFELIESCTRRCLLDVERLLAERRFDAIGPVAMELLDHWHLECEGVRQADETIALTQADAEFTEQLFGKSSVPVVPTCLSRTFVMDQCDASQDSAPAFGEASAMFIGNFSHYPNKDAIRWFMQQVHAKVLAACPDFKLGIAGAGDVKDLRKEFASHHASVRFVGEVPDLVEVLRSAKICLAPLISGAGIRGKIQQYSYVGRPTVSTTIGVCGTPFRHGESILIADDPDAFAQQIVRLLTDAALYESVRMQAKRVALEHFSWAPHIDHLEQIYRR